MKLVYECYRARVKVTLILRRFDTVRGHKYIRNVCRWIFTIENTSINYAMK